MAASMRHLAVPLLLAAGLGLAGCVGAAVGAGAAGGITIAQERSVGAAVDDTVIQANVNHELLQHSEQLFRKVGVEVIEGRVLLTGVVPSADDRVTATRLAWKVKGVKEVLNELEISDKSSVADFAKDAWITTQLHGRLLADQDVRDINYSIETVNGVIYLFGIAQDEAELKRVTAHARTIKGVTKVVSHVVVKTDPRRQS
jgi:osmotically-inducible protein OsmY